MLVYPTTLPIPDVAGNSTVMSSTFARTQLPFSIEQRALFGENTKISLSFTCENREQVRNFTIFYYSTTSAGILPFTVDWPIYGNTDIKVVRFTKTIKTTALGFGIYKIDCQFELLPNIAIMIANETLELVSDSGSYIVDDFGNQVIILRSAL